MSHETQPAISHDVEHAGSTCDISSSRSCLLLMVAASVCWGFCLGLLPEEVAIQAFVGNAVPLFLLSCGVIWCHLDSYRCGVFLSRRFYLCLLLCFAVAYPYYAFKTRGLSGFITLGGSLAFVAICYISVLTGTLLGSALATVGFGA